ncbi:MAG TPA: hypothetical protein VMT94_09530 [Burkholderiales bacterium]|nr:hypothetical protein [Burkholderiales bacterium]
MPPISRLGKLNSSEKPVEFPFAAGAGLDVSVVTVEDPYQALDNLMAAVEALCSVWPSRAGFVDGGKMLL